MKKATKILIWIVIGIVAAVAIFLFGRAGIKKERDLSARNIMAMQDSVKHYKLRVGDLELQVAEKSALVLSKDDAIRTGLIEKEYWRKLHMSALVSYTKLEGELKAAQDSLALPDSVQIMTIKDTTGVARDYVKIPFKLLDIKSEYLTLLAGMNKNRTAYYDLSIPIVGQITVGYKGKTAVGVFTSPNPLLNITNMNIVITPYKTKLYEKWYISGPIGFILGLAAGSQIKR